MTGAPRLDHPAGRGLAERGGALAALEAAARPAVEAALARGGSLRDLELELLARQPGSIPWNDPAADPLGDFLDTLTPRTIVTVPERALVDVVELERRFGPILLRRSDLVRAGRLVVSRPEQAPVILEA